MKFLKTLAPLAAAVALLAAPVASQAGLVVYISDGNLADLVTITDGVNDTGIGFGITGLITFSQSYQGYTVVGSLASAVDNPLAMHLVANVTGSGGQKAITIYAGFNDITSSGNNVLSVEGGGSGYGVSGWAAYTDATNKQYFDGGSNPIAGFTSAGYSTNAGSFAGPGVNPYTATLAASFDYSGIANSGDPIRYTSSQDLKLNVPEPTSVALVGLALLGVVATSRRRKA